MKAIKKPLLWCLFMLAIPLAHPQSLNGPGVYTVTFEVGSNVIEGRLELTSFHEGYRGKIQVFLPTSINLALSQEAVRNGEFLFKTSAPALGATIQFLPVKDSIRGAVLLSGGRPFPFRGKKVGTTADLAFDQTAEVIAESADEGFAFPTLSDDGKILVVSRYKKDFSRQSLVQFRPGPGGWETAGPLPFARENSDRSPFFAPDGYLYFSSKRSGNPGEEDQADYDIWRVNYNKGHWGEPEKVEELDSEANDYQPCVTNKGIFFTSRREGGKGGQDIWYAKRNEGSFDRPRLVGGVVNSTESEISAYVDQNETFMLLSSSNQALGSAGNDDLYRLEMKDGEWKLVQNLAGSINSFANEYGAFVTKDGWLYFTSDVDPWAKIYRVKWKK